MLQRILKISNDDMPKFMDATDALGAAYCHFMQITSPAASIGKTYKSWKDFATKNKERLSPNPSLTTTLGREGITKSHNKEQK